MHARRAGIEVHSIPAVRDQRFACAVVERELARHVFQRLARKRFGNMRDSVVHTRAVRSEQLRGFGHADCHSVVPNQLKRFIQNPLDESRFKDL